MTGAKDFVGSTNALSFRLPVTSRSINAVRVELNGQDLYDITFSFVRSGKAHVKAVDRDCFAHNLRGIFERRTGLWTHL